MIIIPAFAAAAAYVASSFWFSWMASDFVVDRWGWPEGLGSVLHFVLMVTLVIGVPAQLIVSLAP